MSFFKQRFPFVTQMQHIFTFSPNLFLRLQKSLSFFPHIFFAKPQPLAPQSFSQNSCLPASFYLPPKYIFLYFAFLKTFYRHSYLHMV